MIKYVFRVIVAAVAGLLAAFALVVAVEAFGEAVHPFPKDLPATMEEICRHVERFPAWALAVVVPMWGATAFLGAWLAQRLGNVYSFAIVALLLLAGLAFNVSKLPYPVWFKLATLTVIPAAMAVGGWLARRSQARSITNDSSI